MGTKIKNFFFSFFFFHFQIQKGKTIKNKKQALVIAEERQTQSKDPSGRPGPNYNIPQQAVPFRHVRPSQKKNLILVLLLFGASPGINFKIPKISSRICISHLATNQDNRTKRIAWTCGEKIGNKVSTRPRRKFINVLSPPPRHPKCSFRIPKGKINCPRSSQYLP